MIFANILHVHFDQTYWENPEVSNPSQFIDEKNQTFKTNECLIPFLIGKRYCLGQSLAEKEYFLFFVGLLQKFEFPNKFSSDLKSIAFTISGCNDIC